MKGEAAAVLGKRILSCTRNTLEVSCACFFRETGGGGGQLQGVQGDIETIRKFLKERYTHKELAPWTLVSGKTEIPLRVKDAAPKGHSDRTVNSEAASAQQGKGGGDKGENEPAEAQPRGKQRPPGTSLGL